MEILNLSDKKEWKRIFKNSSNDFEVLIYKFSPICNASNLTDVIIDEWVDSNHTREDLLMLKLDVINAKSLSRKIAKDLNVVHESPQVIWLDKNKNVKFQASHYNITKEELDKYL